MSQPTCETCRFFEPNQKPERKTGFCHRYPPIAFLDIHMLDGGEGYSSFPTVAADEWCGEHQPKAEQ